MSLLTRLVGGPAVDAVTAIGSIFDRLFTSEEERRQAEALMQKIAQQPALVQAEINKIEAAHRSIFVAGWRPFIGWVCGCGFAWAFLVHPVFAWYVALRHLDVTPPEIVTDNMMELVIALLGLGVLRTYEKAAGRSR